MGGFCTEYGIVQRDDGAVVVVWSVDDYDDDGDGDDENTLRRTWKISLSIRKHHTMVHVLRTNDRHTYSQVRQSVR